MFRKLIISCLVFILLGTLTACDEYTGHPRCDETVAGPFLDIIEVPGWQLNCNPNFSSTDQYGIRHHAWTDYARKTVWAWPDKTTTSTGMSDKLLVRVLWHESGHVHGADTEWKADAYAYCHMTPEERMGVSFLLPLPTSCKGFL